MLKPIVEKLVELRVNRGLSQVDVSRQIKRSSTIYCRIENGHATRPNTAKALADLYGVSVLDIFTVEREATQ